MKQKIAPVCMLAVAVLLALSLAACGQRVVPKYPEGKIMPSTAH